MLNLADLRRTSMVAVHFVLQKDICLDIGPLGLRLMESSIADVTTKKELFTVVSEAMQFPDYFGKNWDALDECLSDMEWLPSDGYVLVLRGATSAWSRNPLVMGNFVEAWLQAAEGWAKSETPFHVVFVM